MYEVETEELDYLTHNGVSLRARIYRPVGKGPFPAFVDLHGGAWVKGSYVGNHPVNMPIAAGGVVIMSAEYTMPPAGHYPSSVADANYAVRWLKMNATRYGSRPDLVGAMGTSSGGHLAVLSALKPRDPRFSELPLLGGEAFDASVSQIITMWPVICAATLFDENVERLRTGDTRLEGREGAGFGMMKYWVDYKTMEEGSPMLAIERSDPIERPDVLYVQNITDILHAPYNMERFIRGYRKLGGHVETALLDGEPYDILRAQPDSETSKRAFRHIIDFAHGKRVREEAAVGA